MNWATRMEFSCFWCGEFENDAVNRLHAESFGHCVSAHDWWGRVTRHSLGTMVASRYRHLGIATQMLAVCVREARNARCEWLHVDFTDELRELYFDSAGFTPTNAGLINLREGAPLGDKASLARQEQQ